jgi:hypothetical protein
MERVAEVLLGILAVYLAVGFIFALAFVIRGVQRIDPAAEKATLGFRIIILPGAVALWPVLAARWISGKASPEEKNAHRCAARSTNSPKDSP